MDVDRDKVAGWFSSDPIEMVDRHGGRWGTHEFRMGDVLIFGMFTMHGSLDNHSNQYRISCDTRYQRADEPIDERWIGEEKFRDGMFGLGAVLGHDIAVPSGEIFVVGGVGRRADQSLPANEAA